MFYFDAPDSTGRFVKTKKRSMLKWTNWLNLIYLDGFKVV